MFCDTKIAQSRVGLAAEADLLTFGMGVAERGSAGTSCLRRWNWTEKLYAGVTSGFLGRRNSRPSGFLKLWVLGDGVVPLLDAAQFQGLETKC